MEENTTGASDFSLDVELRYDKALADLDKFFVTLAAQSKTALGDIKFDVKPVAEVGQVAKGSSGHVSSLVERTDALTVSMMDLRSAANQLSQAMGKGFAGQFLEHAKAMMTSADDSVNAQTLSLRKLALLDAKYTEGMNEGQRKRMQAQVRSFQQQLKESDKFNNDQIQRLTAAAFGRKALEDANLSMVERVERRTRELRLAEESLTAQELKRKRDTDHKQRVADITREGNEAARVGAKNAKFSKTWNASPAKGREIIAQIQAEQAEISKILAGGPADSLVAEKAEAAERALIRRYGDRAVAVANGYEPAKPSGFKHYAASESHLQNHLQQMAALRADADRAEQAEQERKAARLNKSRAKEHLRAADEQAKENKDTLKAITDAYDQRAKEVARAEAVAAAETIKIRNKAHAEALNDITSTASGIRNNSRKDADYEQEPHKVLARLADERSRSMSALWENGTAYTPAVAKQLEERMLRDYGQKAVEALNDSGKQLRLSDAELAVYYRDAAEAYKTRAEVVNKGTAQELAMQQMMTKAKFSQLSHKEQGRQLEALRDDMANGIDVSHEPEWKRIRAAGYRTRQVEALSDADIREQVEFNQRSRAERLAMLRTLQHQISTGNVPQGTSAWMLRKAAAFNEPEVGVAKPRDQGWYRKTLGADGESNYRSLGNSLHSGARGVTGVAGGTWMTYGEIIPIATAAAGAAAAFYSASKGGQFTRDMGYVRELSREPGMGNAEAAQNVDMLSESILKLSRYSSFSATEMAQSIRTISQAGFNTTQAQQMLPDVNALAVVGDTTTDTAATTIAGTIAAFQLDASQAGRVANVVAMAANMSQTSVESLNETLKQGASAAAEYGVSLEDTATVAALLAKRNIVGSASGTAIKNMLVDLSGRTKESTKYIKQLGIELYDVATGRAKELPKVLDEVLGKLGDLNQRERNFYMHKIFTERGVKPVAAVLGEGMGEYTRMKQSIADAQSNGGYVHQAERRLNETTASGQLRMLKNSFESESITAFMAAEDSLVKSLRTVREELNSGGITSALTSLITLTGKAAEFTATYSGEIAALIGAIGTFGAARIAAGGFAVLVVETSKAAVAARGLYTSMGAAGRSLVAGRVAAVATGQALGASAVQATSSAVGYGRLAQSTWQVSYSAGGATAATTAFSGAAKDAGASATWGARGVTILRFSLEALQTAGPILLALTAAWMLFQDATTTSVDEAKAALKNMDYGKYTSDLSDAFQKVHEAGKRSYEGLTAAGGKYATAEAKTVADVIKNYNTATAAATKAYEDMKVRYSGNISAVEQDFIGRREQIVQDAFELGKKLYDGSLKSKQDLLELARKAAEEEVSIERQKIARITELNSKDFSGKLEGLIKQTYVTGIGAKRGSFKRKVEDYTDLAAVGQEISSKASSYLGTDKQLPPDLAQQVSEWSNALTSRKWNPNAVGADAVKRISAQFQILNGMQGRKQLQDVGRSNAIQVNDLKGIVNNANTPPDLSNKNNGAAEQAVVNAEAAEAAAASASRKLQQARLDLLKLQGASFEVVAAATAGVVSAEEAAVKEAADKQLAELERNAAKARSAKKDEEAKKIEAAIESLKKTEQGLSEVAASKANREKEQTAEKERQQKLTSEIFSVNKATELSMSQISLLGEEQVRQQYALLDAKQAALDKSNDALATGTEEERQRARAQRDLERRLELVKREVALRKERLGEKLYASGSGAFTSSLANGTNNFFQQLTSGKARAEFFESNHRRFSIAEDVVRPAGAAAGNALFGTLVNSGMEKLQQGMLNGIRWLTQDKDFGKSVEEAQLDVLRSIDDKLPKSAVAGAPIGTSATDPAATNAKGSPAQQATDAYKSVGTTAETTSAAVSQNTQMMFSAMSTAVVAFAMRGKSAITQFAAIAVVELLKVYMMQRMVGAVSASAGGPVGGASASAAAAPATSGMGMLGTFAATAAGTAVGGYLANSSGGSNSSSGAGSTVMQAGSISMGDINVEVNVQASGSGAEATGSGQGAAGNAMGQQMAVAVRSVVVNMARSGELAQMIRMSS